MRFDFVDLVDRLIAKRMPGPVIRHGYVTGTGPLTVRLAGDTVDIKPSDQAAHLSLATNDVVVCFKVGRQWIVGLEL